MTQNAWLRPLVWGFLILALTWLLGWTVLPSILKSQIQRLATEATGRSVTLGAVSFKPWSLELQVSDLTVAARSGSVQSGADQSAVPPLLHIEQLYIDAELQSLFRLAPVIDEIRIEGPALALTHLGAGRFDFDDVWARLTEPSDRPEPALPRFALYNLQVSGGKLDFADLPNKRSHEVRDLSFSLPFLSNLDASRDVKTDLRLAFKLNGSPFDSTAQATPFAQSHKTDLSFKTEGFDLEPYLGYLPAGLPVSLQSALLDADLRLAFEVLDKPSLKLSGTLVARKVKLTQAGPVLASFEALKLVVDDARPLEHSLKLSLAELTAPVITLHRHSDGRFMDMPAQGQADAKFAPHAKATAKPASKSDKPAEPAQSAWHFELAKAVVQGGALRFTDDTTRPMARIAARAINLEATDLVWPLAGPAKQPLKFTGTLSLEGEKAADMTFAGETDQTSGKVDLTLSALPLALAQPYLRQFLIPQLSGDLNSTLTAAWSDQGVQVLVKSLTLKQIRLSNDLPGKAKAADAQASPLASIRQLELSNTQIDVSGKRVVVGLMTMTQPQFKVIRESDRSWMVERWRASPQTADPAATADKAAAPQAQPWTLLLVDASLSDGRIAFEDLASPSPVSVQVQDVNAQLKDFSPSGTRPGVLNVSARVNGIRGDPGQLAYQGTLGSSPFSMQGKIKLAQVPLHPLSPYLTTALNISRVRALASLAGDMALNITPAGLELWLRADAGLEDLRVNSALANPAAETLVGELLSWKSLTLGGLELALKPGQATRLGVGETVITDFFTRLSIDETGRFNLQDIVRPKVAGVSTSMPTAQPTLEPESQPKPIINIGAVRLVNGQVVFSDRFVKPNYTANLTALTGKLSAFSSREVQGVPQLADLELRGQAEGSGSLEIIGKINPLSRPLSLDIKGKVRDLELPPLSTYAIKFAGYGIEQGKLDVDVSYFIKPDGQLVATNKIVLNQLKFGDRVESSVANLPVKLAALLLADRRGVIDIDLPLSGSINDPEFEIGPILWKGVLNLIGKAITAPFSLLARMFSGGDKELGQIDFAPGSAELSPAALQSLDEVAKVLIERPALRLSIAGYASLVDEREAFKRERLEVMLQGEKRRQSTAGQNSALTVLTEADPPDLVKRVYRRSDIAKPRNLIGLTRDLETQEMEALLLASIVASEEQMRALALQRSLLVKAYLGQKVADDRLYLSVPSSVGQAGAADSPWVPRVQLNISAN